MSLRVWLPLTKDLRQQGLSDCAVEEITSSVFDSNGKLGKALSEGKIRIPASKVGDIFNNNTMTIAFWYNNNTSNTSGNHAICGFSGNGEGDTDAVRIWDFFNYSVPTQFHWSMGTLGGGSLANAFPANTWVHVCVTWSAPTLKIYLDGVLKYTGSGSSNYTFNKSYYISFGHTPQKLNDFRIYDHCLAPMEVKQLSQGLVLHYPLNRQGWGQENLLPISGSTIIDSTQSFEFQGWVQNFYTKTWMNEHLTPGKQYTLSYTVTCLSIPDSTYTFKENRASPILVHQGSGWSQITTTSDGIKDTNMSVGQSRNYKCTFTFATATENYEYYGLCGYTALYRNSSNNTQYAKFRIDNLKLEEGSIATPWCPNSSDALATTMGLNSTTEYDCSGYCNNGTRINFPQQNLLIGSDFSSKYTSDLVTNGSTDWTKYIRGYNSNTLHAFANGEDTVTLSTGANLGICFVRKAADINLDSNSYYTLSCEAKSTQTTKPLCIGLSYYNNSNTWVWRGGTNPTNFTTANTWQKFSLTFKPDANTQYISYCFTVVGVANGTDTFTIRHCKLEKGSSATPWVDGESGNWTSDTPKYVVSTKFSNNRIQCSGNFLEGLTTATLSAWVKLKSYHSERCMVVFANGRYLTVNSSGQLSGYSYGKTPAGYYNSTKTIPLNTWTHITIVWSDTTWYFYINGELVNSWSCTGTFINSGNYISIGQESNGGRSVSGQISDARVYATALSASDVKSLYQNCATIDPDGTIRGQIRN